MLMVRTGDEVIKDLKTLGWAWFSDLSLKRVLMSPRMAVECSRELRSDVRVLVSMVVGGGYTLRRNACLDEM
jgi:hypothetical protein